MRRFCLGQGQTGPAGGHSTLGPEHHHNQQSGCALKYCRLNKELSCPQIGHLFWGPRGLGLCGTLVRAARSCFCLSHNPLRPWCRGGLHWALDLSSLWFCLIPSSSVRLALSARTLQTDLCPGTDSEGPGKCVLAQASVSRALTSGVGQDWEGDPNL